MNRTLEEEATIFAERYGKDLYRAVVGPSPGGEEEAIEDVLRLAFMKGASLGEAKAIKQIAEKIIEIEQRISCLEK